MKKKHFKISLAVYHVIQSMLDPRQQCVVVNERKKERDGLSLGWRCSSVGGSLHITGDSGPCRSASETLKVGWAEEFKVSLDWRASSKPVWTKWDPVSNIYGQVTKYLSLYVISASGRGRRIGAHFSLHGKFRAGWVCLVRYVSKTKQTKFKEKIRHKIF